MKILKKAEALLKVFSIRNTGASRRIPAFTLVELIVVITILAVLATVGFLALSGYTKDASKSAVKANLKTLAQAVSSESAVNGDSPRRYVVHSGAVVLSGATFSGTTLVPGPYGTPNTNYSAGTADFWALRADSSKFKNPDGTPFLFAALDYSESLPSGKIRSRSFFQVAGFPESGTGTVAVEGAYPSSVGGSSAGLIASSSGSSSPLTDATSSSSSSSGGGGGATRYAGCDTDDITLGNGQVWAACNVGATTAYAGQAYPSFTPPNAGQKAYLGAVYQWGRNDDLTVSTTTGVLAPTTALAGTVGHSEFITNSTAPYDWITAPKNDNLWGGSGTTTVSGTFADRSAWDQTAMRGPCAAGYHVPTQKEWCDAFISVSPTRSDASPTTCTSAWQTEAVANAFRTALKLPLAGQNGGSLYMFQGSFGFYWTSSTTVANASRMAVSTTQVAPADFNQRSVAISVRCLKD